MLAVVIFVRTVLKIIAALWYCSAGHCCAARGSNCTGASPSRSGAGWWERTEQDQSRTAPEGSSSFALAGVVEVWKQTLTPVEI